MKIKRTITGPCTAMLLAVGMVPAHAQEQPQAGAPQVTPSQVSPPPAAPAAVRLSAAQIDELLGPIALYPDPLIAQILPATTYPTDIVIAARLVAKGATPEELDAQGWDSSVRALAHYPSLLKMFDERLAWTQSIGAAFLQQPDDVMDSIQRLRLRARAMGHLNDTPQQKVIIEEEQPETTVVRIVPASPEVVYVPAYDPEIVYVRQYTPTVIGSPWLSFGVGFAVGSWLNLDCDWYGRRCYYPVGWTWATCSPSWWYTYPRYSSFWYGPAWCGPSYSFSFHFGGHHGHHGWHDGHHGHHDDHHDDHHFDRGRTSDMTRRSFAASDSFRGPRRVDGGRTDDRTWTRSATRPGLHDGSSHVAAGSDMYRRTRGPSGGLDAAAGRPQARTADTIRRDLASRSFNPPSRLDRSSVPGVNSRTSDSLRRGAVDTRARTTPGVTDSRDSLRRSNPAARTSPERLRPSTPAIRTSPNSRSTGLTVPRDAPRVRTATSGRSTVAPSSRSSAPRATPAPQRSGRQGLSRPSGSAPRARASSPSSGSRPSVQRSSPSRSSPARSSPSRSSSGGSTGNRRSK